MSINSLLVASHSNSGNFLILKIILSSIQDLLFLNVAPTTKCVNHPAITWIGHCSDHLVSNDRCHVLEIELESRFHFATYAEFNAEPLKKSVGVTSYALMQASYSAAQDWIWSVKYWLTNLLPSDLLVHNTKYCLILLMDHRIWLVSTKFNSHTGLLTGSHHSTTRWVVTWRKSKLWEITLQKYGELLGWRAWMTRFALLSDEWTLSWQL